MPRAGLLERISTTRERLTGGRKEWSEPPFWSLDHARQGWFSGSTPTQERIENDFEGYVAGAYKADGIVFSCIDRRQQVFSQARFQWREFRQGRPGDLFGSPELELLEKPWPNGTTGELLALMEIDASLAGNFYATTVSEDGTIGRASAGKKGRRISRMRPDWTTLVIDAPSGDYWGVDARVVAYLYEPRGVGFGGETRNRQPVTLLPDEVVHYCVDDETEILTAQGWKRYDQLRIGDEAITLNHETGLAEWQPVGEVCIFPPRRRELILMEGHQFSSLTTAGHRWPVEYRSSRQGVYKRRWVTSETVGLADRIPAAAYSADLPDDAKWTDALVELVAWFWTEGTIRRQRDGRHARGISISQSYVVNPDNVVRIRAALTNLFGPSVETVSRRGSRLNRTPRWREGVDGRNAIFHLSADAGDVLTRHAPGKVVTTEFIRSLTAAQLDLFIFVSMIADNNGPGRMAQKSQAMAEQFGLACILAGRAVSFRQGAMTHLGYRLHEVRIKKARYYYPQARPERANQKFRVERVGHDGIVWCPRTPNQTWLARRKGSVYFTGNSPKPDPTARFRGMSWLTPVIREIQGDRAATEHKLNFFRHGATPALVVKGIQAANRQQFDGLVDMLEARHAGADNAYKTLYLTAGADATALGADLKQLDFAVTQGAGETRLAAAGGIPAAILGISEGLRGSSLNAGNFSASRRLFVDATQRDLWAKAAASVQAIIPPPRPNVALWYDARDIPFLREDAKDDAEIRAKDAQALRELTDAGWDPDAAVEYVRTGDITRLIGKHSGMYSVQLQRPMDGTALSVPASALNGSGR